MLSLSAAAGEPKVTVTYGFRNKARSNCWTPVLVEVPQGVAGNFQGQAAIFPSADCDAARGRFRVPVTLTASEAGAASGKERFWLYVRPGEKLFQGRAYLATESGRFERPLTDSRTLGTNQFSERTTVIAVAGMPIDLEKTVIRQEVTVGERTYTPYSRQYETVLCDSVLALPNRAMGYEGIDVLVLSNANLAADLRADQLNALVGFVEAGGRLIVLISRANQIPSDTPIADMLPARAEAVVATDALGPLHRAAGGHLTAPTGKAAVVTLAPKAGSVVLVRIGDAPIAVERLFGMGTATLIGLDVRSPAIRSWKDFPHFIASVIRMAPDFSFEGWSTRCGKHAMQWMAPPGGGVGFFWVVILLTIVYVIVSGPVLYAVLKRRRQRHLVWPLYLAISLTMATVCFALVTLVRNRRVTDVSLTVLDLPADDLPALGRSMHSVRFPDSAVYRVGLDAPCGTVAMMSSRSVARRILSSSGRLFDYVPAPAGDSALAMPGRDPPVLIDSLAVKSNQYREFSTRWRMACKRPVVATVERSRGSYRGTLRSRWPVTRAVLMFRDRSFRLDDMLRPGVTVQLRSEVQSQSTPMFLQKKADRLAKGEPDLGGWGSAPDDEPEVKTSADEVFDDVCLSTFYEMFRRRKIVRSAPDQSVALSRNHWSRSLDLTYLADLGYGVLIGLTDADVPDGVLVNGQIPGERTRLVIFRQVIAPGPARRNPLMPRPDFRP